MVKVIYFPHGTTYDNVNHKASGWKDDELNELGIKQSKELTEQTKDLQFDMIFTSDLKRAVDSSNITWPDFEKVQNKNLKECNYGDLNGQNSDLVVYADHIDTPFPNGECLKDVEKRISNFINYIKEEYDGKTIVVVAHRAPQMAFEVLTKNVTWEEAIKSDWRKKKAWQPGWEYMV